MLIIYFFAVIIFNLTFNANALAVGESSESNQINVPTDNTSIKQTDKDTETQLKNVSASAHHLQKTIHQIIFEVTRQRYLNASQPNVVGPIVIPAIPMPTGVIAMGDFLPPRKKYMDLFAEETRSLMMMLSEEASSLPDTIESDTQSSTHLAGIKKILSDLRIQNDSLISVLSGSKYDNLLIGKQALKMSDDLDRIQKLLKECEKHVEKDIKRADDK